VGQALQTVRERTDNTYLHETLTWAQTGMFQATIHLQQNKDCVLSEFAETFDVSFDTIIEELHDHRVTFVIELDHCAAEYAEFLRASEQVSHFEQLDGERYLVTKRSCGAYAAVDRNHGILRRRSVITANRREYTVLFFCREDLRAMMDEFRQVGDVALGSLSKFHESTSTLTDRQFEVLECALEAGYFEWPRDADSETVAGQLGISRATFLEHLRKAQSKLLTEAIEEHGQTGRAGYVEPRAR
jgi:predicted DNA binding protein